MSTLPTDFKRCIWCDIVTHDNVSCEDPDECDYRKNNYNRHQYGVNVEPVVRPFGGSVLGHRNGLMTL